jgi:hypothetical protein
MACQSRKFWSQCGRSSLPQATTGLVARCTGKVKETRALKTLFPPFDPVFRHRGACPRGAMIGSYGPCVRGAITGR